MRLRYRAMLYQTDGGDALRQQYHSLASDIMQQTPSSVPVVRIETTWRPPTDIYEIQNAYIVKMEIAGMSADDIEVTLYTDAILISGNRHEEASNEESTRFHEAQIHYGPFRSTIFFAGRIDNTHARANYRDGFLQLIVPKIET